MTSPADFFRARGLEPLAWDEVLRRVESLPDGVADEFTRRHRAFVAYPTEHTARAFYDFIARQGLHALLASHRFDRLVAIAAQVSPLLRDLPPDRARVLDVGAGGGFLARWLVEELRDSRGATLSVTDLSPATLDALAAQDFQAAGASNDSFDLILCADSLGEVHADEDEWLADPAHEDDPGFGEELEARYGLAHKLAALRPRLAPRASGFPSRVALFEPAPQAHFWRGAARLLEGEGWSAKILGPDPTWGLILTQSDRGE